MKLLIPGGAGYIGSHMVKLAQELNHDVTVIDNFSTGNTWAVESCEVANIDLLDHESLIRFFKNRYFDGVIHFAAKSLVAESNIRPDLYYQNNFIGTYNLVNAMRNNDINNIVFSSTAAIFGNPKKNKIDEMHPKLPINPYGKSKLIVEMFLEDFCKSYEFNCTSLRYFNAAGAHISLGIGEEHDPETHLIPNILMSILNTERVFSLYGNDYSTNDGTCVRDYIHVTDLAKAHLLSLDRMKNSPGFSSFNLGNGNGYSVMEVIRECERVSNKKIDFEILPRRIGDPDYLIADNTLAKNELGWIPKFSDLKNIISTAYGWHKTRI